MTWLLQVGSIAMQSYSKILKKYGDLSCSKETYLEGELGGNIWKLLYGLLGVFLASFEGQKYLRDFFLSFWSSI